MKTKNADKRLTAFLYAFAFFALFVVFYFTPHNVDDVTYDCLNLTKASDIFIYCAGYGNGRVLGNILACLLCKSQLIAALIRALFVTLIPLLCSKLILNNGNNHSVAYELALLLTVGTDSYMFGNTFAWISAFAVYVPPVLLTLACLLIIKNYKAGDKSSVLKLVAVFVFGICTQLFAENITVYTIILSIILIVLCFKNGRGRAVPLAYFASSVIGAGLMLYARLKLYSDLRPYDISAYQSFPSSLSSLAEISMKSVVEITKGISYNFLLLFAASALLLCIMNNKKNSAAVPKGIIIIQKFVLVFCPFFWLFKHFYYRSEHLRAMKLADNFFCLFTLLAYFICVISVIYLFEDKKERRRHLFLLGFSVLTILPLAVVSPISERVLFYSYTVLILFCLALADTVLKKYGNGRIKALKRGCAAAVAAVCCFLMITYFNNYTIFNAAREYTEYQLSTGNKSVTLYEADRTGYFPLQQFDVLFEAEFGDDVEYNYVQLYEWLDDYYKYGDYKQ